VVGASCTLNISFTHTLKPRNGKTEIGKEEANREKKGKLESKNIRKVSLEKLHAKKPLKFSFWKLKARHHKLLVKIKRNFEE
jgi:hypothetical protein